MNMKRSDLVTIIAVISVLLLLGLTAMRKMQRSRATWARISCVGNLKQIGLSFRVWANDNNYFYPMQIGYKNPTVREDALVGRVYRVFQVMSNELSVPKTLNCSADRRGPAVDWQSFSNSNISYFVGLDAEDTRPDMVLSGDSNLAINGKLLSGVVALGTNSPVTWTREIHQEAGNIGLADGSVQQVTTESFRQQLTKSGDATNRLVFPQ